MHVTHVTLKLEPITTRKPRIALDAAADVAHRIGCCVEIEVNRTAVRISPTAAKGTIADAWNAAKAEAGAEDPSGSGEGA